MSSRLHRKPGAAKGGSKVPMSRNYSLEFRFDLLGDLPRLSIRDGVSPFPLFQAAQSSMKKAFTYHNITADRKTFPKSLSHAVRLPFQVSCSSYLTLLCNHSIPTHLRKGFHSSPSILILHKLTVLAPCFLRSDSGPTQHVRTTIRRYHSGIPKQQGLCLRI